MAFELHHSSIKAYLVPNQMDVTIKLRGEAESLVAWRYHGFDDEKRFILVSLDGRMRWIPIQSISYIEQLGTGES